MEEWAEVTDRLVSRHPLPESELIEVTLESWQAIFSSRIGPGRYQIGKDIMPVPQIMAFLLHELVPLEIERKHPREWRRDATADEKDVVCVNDAAFSFEVKCSSHRSQIFANRSYAQPATAAKKSKDGYYLAVNFEKFGKVGGPRPELTLIRFGWIGHADWLGQASATGQQAHLGPGVGVGKLKVLWRNPKVVRP